MKKRIQSWVWGFLLSCCALQAQQPSASDNENYRYIYLMLDMDTTEVFDKEVNYVKISVQKKFDNGNLFTDSIVIDKKYLSKKVTDAFTKYAISIKRDSNPFVFEYQTQWSLRDGRIFPTVPLWKKHEYSVICIVTPVQPRLIEFEGDLDQLKKMGVSGVTLQVRYKKFNEEVEENLHVSSEQGLALVEKMIYTDKDTRGYVYRLIVNHTTEGKLILPWSAQTEHNYLFADLPPNLIDKSSRTFQEAKRVGESTKPLDGKIPDTEKVLGLFKEIFDIFKE